jgi:hypothetical protein
MMSSGDQGARSSTSTSAIRSLGGATSVGQGLICLAVSARPSGIRILPIEVATIAASDHEPPRQRYE